MITWPTLNHRILLEVKVRKGGTAVRIHANNVAATMKENHPWRRAPMCSSSL
jgi:hypothetical protein